MPSKTLSSLDANEMIQSLYQEKDPSLDNLTKLAKALFNVDLAAVTLVRDDKIFFKSLEGIPFCETEENASFCKLAVQKQTAVVINDSQNTNAELPAALLDHASDIRFYAGIPLLVNGQKAGVFCLKSKESRDFSTHDLMTLQSLAAQAEFALQHFFDRKLLKYEQDANQLSLARYKAIFNEAAAGMIQIDAKGIITSINPSALHLLGYEESELMDHNVSKIMPDRYGKHHDDYLDSYMNGRPPSIVGKGRTVEALHKTGREIPVHLAVSRIQSQENIAPEFIGILQDLNDLKAAEKQLQGEQRLLKILHKGMTDFHSLMSGNQLWDFLREALRDLTNSKFALIGEVVTPKGIPSLKIHSITDLSWNEESRRLMEGLRAGDMLLDNPNSMLGQVFALGDIVLSNDVQNDPRGGGFPPGHPTLHNYLGIPIIDNGQVIGMFAFANSENELTDDTVAWLEPFTATCALLINLYRQIAEREKFTEELRLAKEEMERASQAKTEFLSSMSHELRTPLNSILGFSQLLLKQKKDPLTSKQNQHIEQILSSGNHLLNLINEVLDLAKIESGKMSLSIEVIHLDDVIQESLDTVSAIAGNYNVSVLPKVGLNDIYVSADHIRLKQVLINLLSNAVKYNVSGGKVWVEVTTINENSIRITVNDTGKGIAADKHDQLFQPFNRLGAENSGIEGSGVGLSLTHKLVKNMQGDIGFQSEMDMGSQFWVEFPMAEKHPHDMEKSGTKGVKAQDAPSKEMIKVLYVEDNPANQRLMENIFDEIDNVDIHCAHDAILGLKLAVSLQPRLIIMDINLPGMDGFEALKLIKQDEALAHIPVIALSANAMPSDIRRGKEAGFEDYLTKPLDVDHLLTVLETLLT